MKNPVLKTKRLRITPMTDEEMRDLIARERDAHLQNAYGEMLAGSLAHPEARLFYAAWRIADPSGEMVGDFCFKGAPVNGAVEIGYGILPAHQGRGYMTEAMKAILDWAFSQEDVYFVEAEITPGNEGSRRVLEKSGFQPSGEGAEGPRYALERPASSWMSIYMCLGMSMGVAIGTALDNLALGIPLGMCIGMLVGVAMDNQDKKKRQAMRDARKTTKSKE